MTLKSMICVLKSLFREVCANAGLGTESWLYVERSMQGPDASAAPQSGHEGGLPLIPCGRSVLKIRLIPSLARTFFERFIDHYS